MNITDFLIYLNNHFLVALAVGVFLIVWAIKQTTLVPKAFLPLVAAASGCILGFVIGLIYQEQITLTAYNGLIAGLIAAGGHDAVKSLVLTKGAKP